MFQLTDITINEYNYLISKKTLSYEDILRIAQYPGESLISYCKTKISLGGIGFIEDKITCIQDKNILYFINAINLLYGRGDRYSQEVLNNNLTKEPLRTAIFLARQEHDPKKRFSTFICTACKILLSDGGKKGILNDPIDVKIKGDMPHYLFLNLKNIGNEWYNIFVENKLKVATLAIQHTNEETAYAIILRSLAYSLYFFAPHKYNVANCNDEDTALHLVIKEFLTNLKQ